MFQANVLDVAKELSSERVRAVVETLLADAYASK
jgi:predicted nucleic-acid-binding protein